MTLPEFKANRHFEKFMTDGMCEICSRWFCDSQQCEKKRRQKRNYERYLQRNDRKGYWQRRYEENKEKVIAQVKEWQKDNRVRLNAYQRRYYARLTTQGQSSTGAS